jgi:hypothetical protein
MNAKQGVVPRSALLIAGVSLAACQGRSPLLGTRSPTVSSAYVTGDAARALDSTGHFILPTPTPPWPDPEINAAQARILAEAEVRTYAPQIRSFLERLHKGRIDFRSLQRCGPTLYAETPWGSPPADVGPVTRKALGSKWLVAYCDANAVPTLSISIAALSTELVVKDNKIVKYGPGSGGEIFALGIPPGRVMPVSPESATVLISTVTGRRVSEIPRLFLSAPGRTATEAVWRLVLDAPARVQVRGMPPRAAADQTFYVGMDRTDMNRTVVFREQGAEEPPEVMRYSPGGNIGAPLQTLTLTRRTDAPRPPEQAVPVPANR